MTAKKRHINKPLDLNKNKIPNAEPKKKVSKGFYIQAIGLGLIFVIALIIRLYPVINSPEQFTNGLGPFGDSFLYHQIAYNLQTGHGFSGANNGIQVSGETPGNLKYEPEITRGPGYPFFIYLIYECLCNPDDMTSKEGWHKNWDMVRIVQCVLDALLCLVVFLIVRLMCPESFWPALISAFLYCFSFYNIFYTRALLRESVAAFFLTTAVLFFVLALKNEKKYWWWILAGINYGLVILFKSECLPFLLVILGYIFFIDRKSWGEALKKSLILLISVVIVLAPWTIRNYIIFKKPIIVSTGGVGPGLYWGTFETKDNWKGWSVFPEGVFDSDQEKTKVTDLNNSFNNYYLLGTIKIEESDQALKKLAIDRIRHHPVQCVMTWLARIPQLWYQFYVQRYVYNEASGNFFIFYFIFALYALWGARREEKILMLPVFLFFIYLSLVYLPMHIEPRYGVFLIPSIIALTGIGIYKALTWVGIKKKGQIPEGKGIDQSSGNVKFFFLAHILIVFLGLIAYTNSLNGKFIYDDELLIENNAFIKTPGAIINCFTKNIAEGIGRVSNFYRPMQIMSYIINYDIGKLDVRGYHFTNMILHILVALCVFWLINTLFSNHFLSLVTALLFVVHPIHTEAVSYISGRADSLASFFILLCLITYIKLVNTDRINMLGLGFMIFTYIGALLSKEYSLILPLLLLFYHFVFGKKIKVMEFVSIVAVVVIYIILRLTCFSLVAGSPSTDTVFDRIPGLFVALTSYIKLLFCPFGLHMEYGVKLFSWTDPKAIIGFVLTGMVLAGGYLKRSNKVILFSLGWFLLTLLPVSNLYKIDAYMAEHFLYLPSIGFFLLLSYALSILYKDGRFKILGVSLASVFVIFFLVLTIRQNHYWKDSLTFYSMTLNHAPDSANAYDNLGKIYLEKGDLDQALMDFDKSIKLNPNVPEVYNNIGSVYDRQGRYAQAIQYFNKSIELNPNIAEIYYNRGGSYGKKGDYDEAIGDLNKALEFNPNYTEAYSNLGSIYGKKGDYDHAILAFQKALELNGSDPQVYDYLGIVQGSKGEYDQAIFNFSKAIDINPNYPKAYYDRGALYAAKGRFDDAITDYNKAIELDPKGVEIYNNRASVYYSQGNYDQAIIDYTKAIELNPSYAQAYSNRGSTYINKGNLPQAIQDLSHAIELSPGLALAYFLRGNAYSNQQDHDQAILDYTKAVELKSDFAEAYFNRGNTYGMKGSYDQAILDYNKVIELNPKFEKVYSNLAIIYYNQKEYDNAWAQVRKAEGLGYKMDPKIIDALNNMAQNK